MAWTNLDNCLQNTKTVLKTSKTMNKLRKLSQNPNRILPKHLVTRDQRDSYHRRAPSSLQSCSAFRGNRSWRSMRRGWAKAYSALRWTKKRSVFKVWDVLSKKRALSWAAKISTSIVDQRFRNSCNKSPALRCPWSKLGSNEKQILAPTAPFYSSECNPWELLQPGDVSPARSFSSESQKVWSWAHLTCSPYRGALYQNLGIPSEVKKKILRKKRLTFPLAFCPFFSKSKKKAFRNHIQLLA